MTLEIYGNTKDCIDFALNQNGITIDKLIITRDEFGDKLANSQTIQALLKGCRELQTKEQFVKLLENKEIVEALKTPINPEYVRNLSQKIQEFFSSFDQVELKNYSFMNSMNADTYNITIRTMSNCQFSVFNVDKNSLQLAFEEVFNKYIFASSTVLSINEMQFQIEITKFEDIKKHFYLYKQGSKLLLFSQYGLPLEIQGSQYHVYGEQYSSYQNMLFYNKAEQEVIYTKQGSKLGYEQVQIKGKVLEEQELVSIHQATNSLNDVCIEGFINHKGKVQLSHIQVFNLPIEKTQEQSLLLYKSTKSDEDGVEDISLLPFHEVESSPQYSKCVILRNNAEFKTALSSKTLQQVNGIFFTFSIFSPQLFAISSYLDINCIISKEQLSKSLHSTINWENLEIISQSKQSDEANEEYVNPFSSLLPQKSPEDVEQTNELSSIQDELNMQAKERSDELRTQRQAQHQERNFSNHSTPSNTSSQQQTSSNSSGGGSSSSLYSSAPSPGGSKKSALAMLADEVVNKQKEQQETQEQRKQQAIQQQEQQMRQQEGNYAQNSTSYQNPQNYQNQNLHQNAYQPESSHYSNNVSSPQEDHLEFNQQMRENNVNTTSSNMAFENSANLNYNELKEFIQLRLQKISQEQRELEDMLRKLE